MPAIQQESTLGRTEGFREANEEVTDTMAERQKKARYMAELKRLYDSWMEPDATGE